MLDIGLCMTVRNEAHNIVACLEPIADLFAQVIVIDTGSTDATPELLEDELGISPIRLTTDESRCNALADLRNLGFDRLATPWIMTLDADERIERGELRDAIALDDADLPAGLFCAWDTDMGDGRWIADYKLALFRKGHRHHGLIHDTAQPSLRMAGETAAWCSTLRLRHFPDPARQAAKEAAYAGQIACAMQRQPDWLRYHWFGGYIAYRTGDIDTASRFLRTLHEKRPALFPVESLYASMVLAGILAREDRLATLAVLEDALAYHARIASDFEVRVNRDLHPWFVRAHALAQQGHLADILPLQFPY